MLRWKGKRQHYCSLVPLALLFLMSTSCVLSAVPNQATTLQDGHQEQQQQQQRQQQKQHRRSVSSHNNNSNKLPKPLKQQFDDPSLKKVKPQSQIISEEYHRNHLRNMRKQDTKKETITATTMMMDSSSNNKKKRKILVKCTKDSLSSCLQEIITIEGPRVQISDFMDGSDYFAIELDDEGDEKSSSIQDVQEMELRTKAHVDFVEENFVRTTSMYEDHGTITTTATTTKQRNNPPKRNLGGNKDTTNNWMDDTADDPIPQNVPYGISQVGAPNVWESFRSFTMAAANGADDETTSGTAAAAVEAALKARQKVRGAGAKVCIIDTGVRSTHEDLKKENLSGNTAPNELVTPWNEDSSGHGTHIAGVIGAIDNAIGVVGVSPEVHIHVARVFDGSGSFYTSDLLMALAECERNNVDIINMSFGGIGKSQIEENAYTDLYKKGIILIAASGNRGNDDNKVDYPAGYDSVISVGAVNQRQELAHWSTYNDQVNLTAPGVRIESLGSDSDSSYHTMSGTSMATPHVTGVAALLVSLFPWASSYGIRQALERTARDSGACGYDPLYGNGEVDAMAAAQFLKDSMVYGANLTTNERSDVCMTTEVSLTTDSNGHETTWVVMDPEDRIMYKGGPYEEGKEDTYVTTFDLPQLEFESDCYQFVIKDSEGNGICCGDGKGEISVSFNGKLEIYEAKFKKTKGVAMFGCGRKVAAP